MSKILSPKIIISIITYFLIASTYPAIAKNNVTSTGSPTKQSTFAPMLKKAMPAVVNIKTIKVLDHHHNNPNNAISLGSGVIVDAKNGLILTNQHVIEDSQEIIVTLADGRHTFGEVLGGDNLSDVAVIKIKAQNLTSIPFGKSDKLAVGDTVLAIGNPFGLSQSATSGIVSALGRDNLGLEGYEDFIQTDASINPGNSGGALINTQGELIGINTAILSPEGGNIGIGFAIPIDMAKNLMEQLLNYGAVKRGALGVIAQPLTPDLAEAFDLQGKTGAVISQVIPNSIADMSGLKASDLIVAINKKPVRNATNLKNAIGLIPVGNKFDIDIVRDGKNQKIIAKMLDPKKLTTEESQINTGLAGATLGSIDKPVAGHGTVKGLELLAVNPGSPADREGLKKGDIIISANKQTVSDITTLEKIAKEDNKKSYLLLHILRNKGAYFVALKS